METELTIQQVAELTGLSIDTLRYYERAGLLEPIRRAPNGHRRYTQHDLSWIDLLIRLRETGMPLAQIVRFGQLRRMGDMTLTERRIMLEEHQQALQERMQKMEQHMAMLQEKLTRLKEREARRGTTGYSAFAFRQGESSVASAGGSEPEKF
jgi:DNA-binding transcriptional MerR regulator